MAKRIFLVWDYTLSRQRYDACLGTDGVPKYAAKIGKGIYRCYAGDEACHKMKKINDEPICSFYNENR